MYFHSIGVYSEPIEGHLVFGDLKRDRYLCLSKASTKVILQYQKGELKTDAAELRRIFDDLIKKGLITNDPSSTRKFAGSSAPVHTGLNEDVWPYLSIAQTIPFGGLAATGPSLLVSYLRARAQIRSKAFLRDGRSSELQLLPDISLSALSEVRKFARLFLLLSIGVFPKNSCLLKALTLRNCLKQKGIHTTLVFGVCVQPFRAHCWLSYGNLVLTDRLDTIEAYGRLVAL